MKSVLTPLMLACLSGCIATGTAVPTVGWGNSGSIHGGFQVSIDANEMISSQSRSGNGEVTQTERRAPIGTFAIIDQRATAALNSLNDHASSPACPDAGTTYIERSNRHLRIRRVETPCPESDFDTAITDLNALIAQHLSFAE